MEQLYSIQPGGYGSEDCGRTFFDTVRGKMEGFTKQA